jgi:hypothetical protein
MLVRVNPTLKKIGNGERSPGKVLVGGETVVRALVEEERVQGRRVSIVILIIVGVRSLMMIV